MDRSSESSVYSFIFNILVGRNELNKVTLQSTLNRLLIVNFCAVNFDLLNISVESIEAQNIDVPKISICISTGN